MTVTRRPLHPSIAAGLYSLTTSPGFFPALCEKWSGFLYVHRVWLSYTRDRRLKVSSERLGNEDKAPCPRALLPGRGSNRGPPVWKLEVLTAQPRHNVYTYMYTYADRAITTVIFRCTGTFKHTTGCPPQKRNTRFWFPWTFGIRKYSIFWFHQIKHCLLKRMIPRSFEISWVVLIQWAFLKT